jgi:hypothetical protein
MVFGRTLGIAAAFAGLLMAGCVDRRFVIESNVPNAQVYIDNRPIGAAPAHSPFEYYGYYNVTLVQPGYETRSERVHVVAPWYAYPPFDFFAEVVWPFHIRDTRRFYFELQEGTKTRVEDLVNDADALRRRGWDLPQPERPAAPKPRTEPPGSILPPPTPIVPPAGPVPSPELVPSVRP